MTDDQLKQARFQILHFPTVLGADVPSYKIPGVSGELNFTPEALAGIFLGKITKWNDPAIASANPGVKLPATTSCCPPLRWQRHYLHLDRLSFQDQPGVEEKSRQAAPP